MRRRQRAAISQAEIRKKCKQFGALVQGARAFERGVPLHKNPHNRPGKIDWKSHRAWLNGWFMARDKAGEKR